jgi:hypothetical protein
MHASTPWSCRHPARDPSLLLTTALMRKKVISSCCAASRLESIIGEARESDAGQTPQRVTREVVEAPQVSCPTPAIYDAVLDAFSCRSARAACDGRNPPPRPQEQLGHHGRKHDPLYRIRNALRAGADKLTARQGPAIVLRGGPVNCLATRGPAPATGPSATPPCRPTTAQTT